MSCGMAERVAVRSGSESEEVMSNARRYYQNVKEDRSEWATNFHCCMGCGGNGDWRGLQIHEICRRGQASKAWGHRANYLLLCAVCHEGVFANAPHAFQLAVKYMRDKEHYSLDDWRNIDDPTRRANRVTEQEVLGWVKILRSAA